MISRFSRTSLRQQGDYRAHLRKSLSRLTLEPCNIRQTSDSLYLKKYIIEPPHDKTNEMACAPNENSDQPGHPPSLIRVFAVRMKKPWLPIERTAKTLIRLGGCPGWSESSLGATFILLVLSCRGSYFNVLSGCCIYEWIWSTEWL